MVSFQLLQLRFYTILNNNIMACWLISMNSFGRYLYGLKVSVQVGYLPHRAARIVKIWIAFNLIKLSNCFDTPHNRSHYLVLCAKDVHILPVRKCLHGIYTQACGIKYLFIICISNPKRIHFMNSKLNLSRKYIIYIRLNSYFCFTSKLY